ncbi:MAG: cell envelope integrity protein CreD [Xanthobacteraceae bacterium]
MTDTYEPFPQADAPVGQPIPPKPPRAAPDYTSLSLHKILLVAGIAIATLLPNMVISNLIEEREQREAGVRAEFTRNWGPEQNLYSPTLVIPYQSGPSQQRQYVKVAPARLDFTANLAPQERRRGLFRATVYDAKIDMQGSFVVPAEARLREFVTEKDARFLWNEAMIAFGAASSLTGLRSTDNIAIDGAEQQWVPCLEAVRLEYPCRGAALVLANAPLPAAGAASTRMQFKSAVTLRGTGSFTLQYPGKELAATFRSPWPSPSFNGNTLPLSSTISADGFEATWQTVEFGSPRITSSNGIIDGTMWKGPTVGVELIQATPIYRMINRVAKYGLLFIILSFATYFFFEVLSRLRIHVVQYGLLGVSLSLFSLLLLSLAEPIGYTNGYLVAASLVLLQSTLYTAAVARRFMPAFLFALMLASLFAFIYVLLGLETYSLLIGALTLFAVVSALMVLTQMINLPGRLTSAPA